MHEIIERVARDAGVNDDVADRALRIMLGFLRSDGPTEKVDRMVAELGLEEFADAAPKSGMLGRLGGFLGGGAMAAFSSLTALGLDLDQIQRVAGSVLGYARERVGDPLVDDIVADIPGLSQIA